MNPVAVGLPIAGFLLLLLGAGSKKGHGPITIPTGDALRTFAASVCRCAEELAESGGATADELRLCVVSRAFPTVAWPATTNDHATVRTVWTMAGEAVAIYLADPAAYCAQFLEEIESIPWTPAPTFQGQTAPVPQPPPDPGPEPEPAPDEVTEIDRLPADAPGYPWEAPTVHLGSDGYQWPTPSTFYQVGADDTRNEPQFALRSILGIARAALGSAYAMAGAPRPLGDIPDALVLDYAQLIVCSPWTDALFGQTDPAKAGGSLGIGPQGRGPAMLTYHRRVLDRLAGLNETPTRAIRMNGTRDPSVESDNVAPELWLPAINLETLVGQGIVTTQGLAWSDGSSTLNPPPAVWSRGVAALVSPPGGWGC